MNSQKLCCSFALVCCCATLAGAQDGNTSPAWSIQPQLLSFDELTLLSATAQPQGTLQERLDQLLTTPFVHNQEDAEAIKAHRPSSKTLGPFVRTAFWNIERGLNFDLIRSVLSDPVLFQRETGSGRPAVKNSAEIERQIRALQDTDILILNEVDLGMKRTAYRDVTSDLAHALQMNYAFGVEFVEVDPLFDLGVEGVDLPDKAVRERVQHDLKVDPQRYRGLHGNALLSRFPIRRARIVRLPVCYDWYGREAQAIAELEHGKRWTARKLFRERIDRELRHGGRMALIADLSVPGSPTGEVTVMSAHLENKCPPRCRNQQMQALLAAIKNASNPVILAGDLNTSGSDATPTSVRNEIMKRVSDYGFWINQATFWFSPVSIPQYLLIPVRYLNAYLDPTAMHIPFFWRNDERKLFKTLERFRFADGRAFDFRGRPERTVNKTARTLADSNERGAKGFVPTYSFARDYGGIVGRFKLDWFLVKPFIDDPRRKGQSYRFAPHYPVTMRELNGSVADRIADHPPLTVDLPLNEPPLVPSYKSSGSR